MTDLVTIFETPTHSIKAAPHDTSRDPHVSGTNFVEALGVDTIGEVRLGAATDKKLAGIDVQWHAVISQGKGFRLRHAQAKAALAYLAASPLVPSFTETKLAALWADFGLDINTDTELRAALVVVGLGPS